MGSHLTQPHEARDEFVQERGTAGETNLTPAAVTGKQPDFLGVLLQRLQWADFKLPFYSFCYKIKTKNVFSSFPLVASIHAVRLNTIHFPYYGWRQSLRLPEQEKKQTAWDSRGSETTNNFCEQTLWMSKYIVYGVHFLKFYFISTLTFEDHPSVFLHFYTFATIITLSV